MVLDLVDTHQAINGRMFTVGWLLESLRDNDKVFQALHGHRAVKEVTACDISAGKGFLSEILQCTLTFADSTGPKDCYTTILKIPGFQSLKDACQQSGVDANAFESTDFSDVHLFECEFYSHIAPILDGPILKVYKMVEWIPGKQDGCIHMEDLTVRGKNMDFFEIASLTQVKNYIRDLAHMHKTVLSADPKIWQGKFSKNQEVMVNCVDMLKMPLDGFYQKCKREEAFRPLTQKYQKLAFNKDYFRYFFIQAYKDLEIQPVLVHGDIHPGNLMWSVDANGDFQPTLAAIIDWQIVHKGSPMFDLACFLLICTDGVVRRQAEVFAVDFYLECLAEEFGDKSKVPYTAKQLQRSYDMSFLVWGSIAAEFVAFLSNAIENRGYSQGLKEAAFDSLVLKALHAYEDVDRLLQGDLKNIYEKYCI